jgi:hypothetical protein
MSHCARQTAVAGAVAVAWAVLAVPAWADEAPVPEDATPAALPADATLDEALPFRLSLPTQDDRTAWLQPGFRTELGFGYGGMFGLGGAPGATSYTPLLRVGARLDASWSLLGSFQYAAVSDGLLGLRFAGTVDPVWHVTEQFSLAAGLGFGGLVEGRTGRKNPDEAQSKSLVASYTLPDAYPPTHQCNGVGTVGLLRAAWHMVLGPISALSVQTEGFGQWTGCEERVGRVEPDSARPIVRRQWLPHVGWTAALVVGWR